MKIVNVITVVSFAFLFGCQDPQTENTNDPKKADGNSISENIRSNTSYLNSLQALENIFSNDNWLIPLEKDTCFFYFSRVGNFTVNTYEYKIVKGDSANVKHSYIKTGGDTLSWEFGGQRLLLAHATPTRAVWFVPGKDSIRYEFLRIDNDHIKLTYPDKKEVVFQKTLPFSLFLVRSSYDYRHGTRYAYDSTQFGKKRK
jgi:hypothetical protein